MTYTFFLYLCASWGKLWLASSARTTLISPDHALLVCSYCSLSTSLPALCHCSNRCTVFLSTVLWYLHTKTTDCAFYSHKKWHLFPYSTIFANRTVIFLFSGGDELTHDLNAHTIEDRTKQAHRHPHISLTRSRHSHARQQDNRHGRTTHRVLTLLH